jgi:maleylacetate reductase
MLNGVHRHIAQDQVVYGRAASETLRGLLDAYGKRRALFVTTRSLSGTDGLARRLAADTGERCVGLYDGISAHAPRGDVIGAAAEARRVQADILVAIGGGSVTDACKVIQLCVWNGVTAPSDLDSFRAGVSTGAHAPTLPADPLRMIAIPTTLSAAEFTPFGGSTDTVRHAKEAYSHPLFTPRAVILDPAMTLSTPERLWFSTGIKALDHSVEALCAIERVPYADALATEALELLATSLPVTKANPDDLDSRLQCQIAMWLAISGAVATNGLGASHAIGHTLGGLLGVPHGLTSCVALPAVLRWNEGIADERQRLVAELMSAPGQTASEAVRRFCSTLGLPTTLAEIGVSPDQFQAIAEQTMHDRGVRTNPRPIRAAADVVEILMLAA